MAKSIYDDDASKSQIQGGWESAPLLGGFASGDRMENTNASNIGRLQKALQGYEGLQTPDLKADDAYWNSVGADPDAISAQKNALRSLQGLANPTGLTAADTARLGQMRMDTNGATQQGREAIMRGARGAGQANSGGMLANMLLNEQNASNQFGQGANQVQSDAADRGMGINSTMMGAGSDLSNQSFDQAAGKADALTGIDQKNQALKQQMYGNAMNLQGAKVQGVHDYNSAITGGAQQASMDASANRQAIGGILKAIMGAVGGATGGGSGGGGMGGMLGGSSGGSGGGMMSSLGGMMGKQGGSNGDEGDAWGKMELADPWAGVYRGRA